MKPGQLGQLWGISVGPGDPELLTLKAVRYLQQAAVVAFPAGRGQALGMAQQIMAPFLKAHQIQLPLYFPYVQAPDELTTAWQAAAYTVWQHLEKGLDVAFATEGDASFYSTFTYLAQTVRQQHPEVVVSIVPGVCSPLAATALLKTPLTVQHQRLMVLPALYTVDDLEVALDQAEVVVLMKFASVYPAVWSVLRDRDLLHHSRVVVRATHSDQQVFQDLEAHPQLKLPYFSLMIIHTQQ